MTEECWDDFNFEEQPIARFLTLPNSVMEHVCRYLPYKRDKYEACLIHPQWTFAAQNVLWEYAHFKSSTSFIAFEKAISESRKLALLVKDIYLAFMDQGSSNVTHHLHESLFQPVVRSKDPRHRNVMANPSLISHFSRYCENLVNLTCYGWKLSSMRFKSLASDAKNLINLSLIGAPPNYIHDLDMGLLARLTTLRLDGEFHFDDSWAEQFIRRATHLSVLQISLQNMNTMKPLQLICTPNRLPLTELVLTDATQILDQHIPLVLGGFPNLTRFVLEGSTKITAFSIFYAIKSCVKLASLEIRAHPDTLKSSENTAVPLPVSDYQMEASPCRLVLENLKITNEQLGQLSPCFTFIQTLGLKNCPLITSAGLKRFLIETAIKYLRVVHILNCPDIDSGLFSAIASIPTVAKSLFRVQLESCGPCYPRDIYDLCCASAEHNLRELTIVGDDAIQNSIIGFFAHFTSRARHDMESDLVVTSLDRASIDALAHSTAPELYPVPDDRTLSGAQILLLASHFNLSVHEFVDLLDKTQEEARENMTNQSNVTTNGKLPHKKNISFDESTNSKPPSAFNNRLYTLKGQSSSQRPTTPALWSNDFQVNNIHTAVDNYEDDNSQTSSSSNNTLHGAEEHYIHPVVQSEEEEEEYGNISNSSYEGYEDDQYNQEYTEPSEQEETEEKEEEKEEEEEQYKEKDSEEDDEEEYITTSTITENQKQPASNDTRWEQDPLVSHNARSEINIHLGGWGTSSTVVDGWSTRPNNKNNHLNNDFTIPSAFNSSSNSKLKGKSQQQTQQPQAWMGYVEENYKDYWQQSGLEVNKSRASNKFFTTNNNNNKKHSRNGPIIDESDGWGVPQSHVPWGSQESGFVKDVIEQQRNTGFWQQKQDGSWEMLNNPGAAATNGSSSIAANTTTTTTTTTNNNNNNSDNDTATLIESSSPSLLFTDIVAGTASSSTTIFSNRGARMNGNIRYSKTHNRVNNNTVNNNNNNANNNNNNYTKSVTRKRSESLLSDDGQVDWNNTAGVKIILDDPVTNNYKAATASTSSPKKAERSNWASFDEWKATKDPSTSSFNEVASPPSKVTQEETATSEWSSINAQRFSRPARNDSAHRSSGAPRYNNHTRESNNNTKNPEAFNSWADYTNSNNISPTSAANNSSSLRHTSPHLQQQQQQSDNAMLLIDTDNSTPLNSQHKGDVWESISSLEVPPVTHPSTSNEMLIYQEVTHSSLTPTKAPAPTPITITATEVFDWSDPVQEEKSDDLLHFTERQPGTITQIELDIQAQRQAQDTLIHFEDFLTSSPAPVKQQQDQTFADLMSGPDFINGSTGMNDIMTPTLSNTYANGVVSTENHVSDAVRVNTFDATPAPATATAAATTATTATAASSYSNAIASSSASEDPQKEIIKVKMSVEVGNNEGRRELSIAAVTEDEVKKQVEDFCMEYNCMHFFDPILNKFMEKWTKKHTKYILGKSKKTKKHTSGSSPAAS